MGRRASPPSPAASPVSYSSVRVGVAVVAVRVGDGAVLVGCRESAHGRGCWGLPGGHLEPGETWDDCARRETLEETGVTLLPPRVTFLTATNNLFPEERRHSITLFVRAAAAAAAVPQVRESTKATVWEWVPWSVLVAGGRSPLFQPLQVLVDSGYTPDGDVAAAAATAARTTATAATDVTPAERADPPPPPPGEPLPPSTAAP